MQATECPPTDSLLRKVVEPALDLVQPRGSRRDEVDVEAGVPQHPPLHFRGRVGREIVEHEVQVELGGRAPVAGPQEGEELHRWMPLVALPEDPPLDHLQRSDQVRGTVASIVVGLALGNARSEGKDRRGSVERLDLGPLVHAQHERMLGRIEVEGHDVPKFLLEVAVGAELVVGAPMGLEATDPPDPRDGVR